MIVFENEDISIQMMKYSFICNFWSWSKSCLDVRHLPLINFFVLLGSRRGLMSFCIPLLFVLVFWHLLYTPPYMLWVAF